MGQTEATQPLSTRTPRISARGAACAVIAAGLFFAAGDIAAKSLSTTMPPTQIAWLRYLVFSLVAIPAAFALRGRHAMYTSRPFMQAARALAITGSTALFIMGLGRLGVAEATAINFTSPIMLMAISTFALGETAGSAKWTASFVAFLGALLIARPVGDAFVPGALFPAGAAFCWAVSSAITRAMASERAETTLVWSSIAGTALLALTLPFAWHPPDGRETLLALAVGLFSTAGNWLVIAAFRAAPASFLAPFFYIQIVSAGILSWLLLGAATSYSTFLGASMIAVSGLVAAKPAGKR